MKTMKNILYALFAVAALVMVGCTKDQTYTPGEDLSGEQIYIDNSTTTFYVQTAAEKEEEAKELKKLSKGLKKDEVYSDDSHVDLKIVRKGSKLEQFDFDVKLTLPAENLALFTLPAGSTQTGADQAAETVIYTVPCSFEAEAAETVVRLGFDIKALETNVEYEFVAQIDNENLSNYGADTFEFVICHAVPVELPFKECGTIMLSEDFYGYGPYEVVIEVHEADYKAWKEEGKEMPYIRYRIPKYMYQIMSAAVAAGDEAEGVETLFENCDDVLFNLTTKYEHISDYVNKAYASPMADDITKGGQYNLYGLLGIDKNGNPTTILYDGYATFNGGLRGGFYFHPENCANTRVNNTFTLMGMLCDIDAGSLYGAYLTLTFQWTKNPMEDDWANYFKIDFNNDINYNAVGEGIFTSEYQGNFATKTLYKGVDEISGNTVYYVDDAYGTTTEATGYLGLALTWNGTTAKVAEMQPLNIQWNGRELYASQSQNIKSAIAFNENGNITKITFGVAVVNEDGAVLGDYTETFDIEAPATGLEAFFGDFTQYAYELYGPFDEANQVQSLTKAFIPLSSTVTIEQATDKAGNPIKNKVHIKGLVPDDYCVAPGGYLEGTYDPSTNTIDVPAQFFHDLEWDGSQLVGAAIPIFPYFQPGLTNYGAYNTSKGPMWMSELGSTANSLAIHYKNGMLEFGSSTNDPASADGYSIILGYYDADYDEFVVDAENMTFFTTISWPSFGVPNPTLIPAQAGGGVMPLAQPKFIKKSAGSIDAKASFEARKARGEKITVTDMSIKK